MVCLAVVMWYWLIVNPWIGICCTVYDKAAQLVDFFFFFFFFCSLASVLEFFLTPGVSIEGLV